MSKVEFETFRQLGSWEQNNIQSKQHSCFNGKVNIRKTRVTFEVIEEPIEVLCDRLQNLWDHSDNYHDYDPIQNVAKSLKYELIGSRGNKVVRK